MEMQKSIGVLPQALPPPGGAQPISVSTRRFARVRLTFSRAASNPLVRIAVLSGIAATSYVLALFLRSSLAIAWTQGLLPDADRQLVPIRCSLLVAGQLLAAYAFRFGHPLRDLTLRSLATRVGLVAAVSPALLLLYIHVATWEAFPRSVTLLYAGLDAAVLLMVALVLRWLERARRERVLLVGPWSETEQFLRALKHLPSRNRCLYPPDWLEGRQGAETSADEVRAMYAKADPDCVYVMRGAYDETLVLRLLEAVPPGVRIFVIPSTWDSAISRLALGPVLGDMRLVEMRPPLADPVVAGLKRLLDVILSAILLVLLSPLLALLMTAVSRTSRGGAFYRQPRVGRNGRVFRIVKLRTMVEDAEAGTGPVLSREGDDRVAPLGARLRALRLDELPQLWNVLAGDMSLVGPRPERPEMVNAFRAQLPGYDLRHRVRPGITGMAQLYGRYQSHPRAYLYNHSLGLDLLLIVKTGWDLLTWKLMWK
jgi:lipopolysaccharide/colanic/teichoic acid biosynthesis glycosyltransferase